MRSEAERIHLTKLMRKLGADLERYNKIWGEARNLSYAGSTFQSVLSGGSGVQ